jgi:hypothetical protein
MRSGECYVLRHGVVIKQRSVSTGRHILRDSDDRCWCNARIRRLEKRSRRMKEIESLAPAVQVCIQRFPIEVTCLP